MNALDWTIVAAFSALTIGLGLWLSRRAGRSTDDYFLSGRTLPWWLAGTSMVATSFASDTPLFVSAITRTHGIWRNWLWWNLGISAALATFVFARLWRRSGVTTEVGFCELRYGGRGAAALRGFKALYFGLLYNCFVLGAWPILGLGKIMEVTTGVSPAVAIGACAVIAAIYCVASGFWGVVVTDFLQFIVAMTGAVVLAVAAVSAVGGLDALTAQVPADRLRMAPFSGVEWPWLVSLLAVQWWAFKNADGGGIFVQRVAACKSESHAVGASLWYTIAHYALRSWPWILVGLASIVLIPAIDDPEKAYPTMVMRYLPHGLIGLVVASFLAAFMSTADTHMNWGASYFVCDLYKRFWVRDRDERHYVRVSRAASLAILAIACVVAWQVRSITAAFDAVLGFTAGIGPVLLARWLWWRTNAWSEIAAIVASGALYLTWPLLEIADNRLWMLSFVTFGSMAVWVIATLVTRAEPRERLVVFYRRVRPPGFWGPIAREAGMTPESAARPLGLWLAGTALTFCLTLGIGKALFGAWGEAMLLGGGAVLAVAALLRWGKGVESSEGGVTGSSATPMELRRDRIY